MSEKATLRAMIHVMEKRTAEGEPTREKTIRRAKKLFRRNETSLSDAERDWCANVLFGIVLKEMQKEEGLLKKRRSIRRWREPVTKEQAFIFTEAAKWAPSGCNRQPTECLFTWDEGKIQRLAEIKKQKFVAAAPSCIVMLADKTAYEAIKDPEQRKYFLFMDAGAAIQNILIEATIREIGMCWVNIEPQDQDEIAAVFNIPEKYQVTAIIPCGTPAETPRPPGRKETEKMLYFEKWKDQG